MITAIGKVGQEILKHLYTGKKWVGVKSKVAAELAAKKGYVKTSKTITGVSQKGNLGIKWGVEKAKKYNLDLGQDLKSKAELRRFTKLHKEFYDL